MRRVYVKALTTIVPLNLPNMKEEIEKIDTFTFPILEKVTQFHFISPLFTDILSKHFTPYSQMWLLAKSLSCLRWCVLCGTFHLYYNQSSFCKKGD